LHGTAAAPTAAEEEHYSGQFVALLACSRLKNVQTEFGVADGFVNACICAGQAFGRGVILGRARSHAKQEEQNKDASSQHNSQTSL
jgi:hypothetical protein